MKILFLNKHRTGQWLGNCCSYGIRSAALRWRFPLTPNIIDLYSEGNSFAQGKFDYNIRWVNLKLILVVDR